MKFHEICLENIFAYESEAKFDLSATTPERNIVLIWGRNGMGKTSFLRSMKLLFAGAGYAPVRAIGYPPRNLNERQFILGDGGAWSGLINRSAAARAAKDGSDVTASVAARWETASGLMITARRQWVVSRNSYDEQLTLYDGHDRLAGEAAQERIADFLPPEFVDFFFFDGDDIMALSESDEKKPLDFDRLLRISFVTALAEELGRVAQDRHRDSLEKDLQTQIGEAEAAKARAEGIKANATTRWGDVEEALMDHMAELRRQQRRRDTLSSGASEVERANLEDRRTTLRNELAEQKDQIALTIPKTAPVVANLALVKAALVAVEARLEKTGQAEQVFARKLSGNMPGWLKSGPVDLTDPDVAALAEHLDTNIMGELNTEIDTGLFASLDPLRAERLRDALLRWQAAGEVSYQAQVAQLTTARRTRQNLADVEEALLRIEVGSQANIEQYREVVTEISRIEEKVADAHELRGRLSAQIEEATTQIADAERRIQHLLQSQVQVERDRVAARYMNRIVRTLNDVREELRVAIRERLETQLTKRFRELVQYHHLVDRVAIDDLYTMTFLDAADQPVGRRSLSSGLKQLAATALLWAMKDLAEAEMAVVIDTPLSRIDRQNQEHMLRNYYPNLAEQVIILPTTSEIDKHKFVFLEDHVAVEYRIDNETGDRAVITRASLRED
ncbi:MAG: DNA sulfur modification protein DndD [Sphingomonas sp.]|jgi:DNA sulfur modification protein DndD